MDRGRTATASPGKRSTSRSPSRRGRSTTPSRRGVSPSRAASPSRMRSTDESVAPRPRGRPRKNPLPEEEAPIRERSRSPVRSRSPARSPARSPPRITLTETVRTEPVLVHTGRYWGTRATHHTAYVTVLAILMVTQLVCLLFLNFPRPPAPFHNVLTFLRTQAYFTGFSLLASIPILLYITSPFLGLWAHVLTALPSILNVFFMLRTHYLWRECLPQYTENQRICDDFAPWYINLRGFTGILIAVEFLRFAFAVAHAYGCWIQTQANPRDNVVTHEVTSTLSNAASSSSVSASSSFIKHHVSTLPSVAATIFEIFSLGTLFDGFSWVYRHEGSPEWAYLKLNKYFGADGRVIACISLAYLAFAIFRPSFSRGQFILVQVAFLFSTLMSVAWEELNWHVWHPELESKDDLLPHAVWFERLRLLTTMVIMAQFFKAITIGFNLFQTLVGAVEERERVTRVVSTETVGNTAFVRSVNLRPESSSESDY